MPHRQGSPGHPTRRLGDGLTIGTWNLAGRWSDAHRLFLIEMDADVLLLTEVPGQLMLQGYQLHRGGAEMAPGRKWAAIASRRDLAPLPDPHPASAMATIAGITYCSTVLPWRSAPSRDPWIGVDHAAKTEACLAELLPQLPRDELVWGGDFNHSVTGREMAGSLRGRQAVLRAAADLGLTIATASLPHRLPGLSSIDHIAVPRRWAVTASRRLSAVTSAGSPLSDHDGYAVTVEW